jgi:hypothetical protein
VAYSRGGWIDLVEVIEDRVVPQMGFAAWLLQPHDVRFVREPSEDLPDRTGWDGPPSGGVVMVDDGKVAFET